MARGRFRPTIVSWIDLHGDGFPTFPDLQLLPEGDSWYTVSGFPAYNLLFQLRFHQQTRIVNCGMPGDTIKHILERRWWVAPAVGLAASLISLAGVLLGTWLRTGITVSKTPMFGIGVKAVKATMLVGKQREDPDCD